MLQKVAVLSLNLRGGEYRASMAGWVSMDMVHEWGAHLSAPKPLKFSSCRTSPFQTETQGKGGKCWLESTRASAHEKCHPEEVWFFENTPHSILSRAFMPLFHSSGAQWKALLCIRVSHREPQWRPMQNLYKGLLVSPSCCGLDFDYSHFKNNLSKFNGSILNLIMEQRTWVETRERSK
jgi:hypothetical protein